MRDLDVEIPSQELIETLRERIAELEDLEARGAATPDTCEILVDLQELWINFKRCCRSKLAGRCIDAARLARAEASHPDLRDENQKRTLGFRRPYPNAHREARKSLISKQSV